MTVKMSAIGGPAFDVACMGVFSPVGEKGLMWWREKMLRSPKWCENGGGWARGSGCDREVGREVPVWRARVRRAGRRGGRWR